MVKTKNIKKIKKITSSERSEQELWLEIFYRRFVLIKVFLPEAIFIPMD
jgi:hypothetical protein